MKKAGFLLIIIGCFFTSCSDFFESPLPDYELTFQPKLYVFSVISPNLKTTTVEIKRNQPLSGLSSSRAVYVDNATVKIVAGKDTITLWYDAAYEIYRVSADTLLIKPKATYQLFVTTPDGLKAQSECTVPDTLLKTADLKVYYNNSKDVAGDSSFSALLTFKNLEGEGDFYDVIYEDYNYYSNPATINSVSSWGLFQGKNALGSTLSTKEQTYYPQYRFNKTQRLSFLKLLLTDENYYRYHQTVRDFQRARENPFAEDSPVFSNIKGGLGIFAAFTRKNLSL